MRIGGRTLAGAGVFAALVGVELFLAHSMASGASIRGFVEARSYSVTAPVKGVVGTIDVALAQSVKAGQVIAQLDTAAVASELADARARRVQIVRDNGDSDTLAAVDTQIEQLARRIEEAQLRAPADGLVESLEVHVGETIGASGAVATIVSADTQRVLACIPESRLGEVAVGQVAEVTTVVGEHVRTGVVESVTPAIAPLESRCASPFVKLPPLGRMAVVHLDAAAPIIPGQSAMISFRAETRPVPQTVPAATTGVLTPLVVPDALAAVTPVEASGIVWAPALERYIVVSDETGTDESHPPWLLTMNSHGVFDPTPLVVRDCKGFDDAESIALDDHGGLFILASQSYSEHGKRPELREMLIHAVPEQGGYRAEAQIAFASLLDAAPDLRTTLGIADTSQLDIEGMAWRNGALYIGLKAPLDDKGRAMIWRVGDPAKLLARDLAGAQMTRWASVALPIETATTTLQGGIADLLFLDDTHVVVGATPSSGSAKHAGGVVFAATVPGDATATILHAFPGERPEGITRGSDPSHLVVVFDRGRGAPMWSIVEAPPGAP
ncbi:MAG TPA: efflux RND transporter periplasmic adaptor subunit [Kofleriaceae bacterium]|jgi:multidrug efflux pump subunit AcrA (membrane-fusion protein)